MSICVPCTKLNPISFCGSEESVLVIGVIAGADLGSGLYANFLNLSNDAQYVMAITNEFTSGGGGINTLSIEYSGEFPLASGQQYEFWVNDPSESSSPEGRLQLVVGGVEADCFLFSGLPPIYNLSDEVIEIFDTQTLKIAN